MFKLKYFYDIRRVIKPILLISIILIHFFGFSQSSVPIHYSGSSTIGRCLQKVTLEYDSASVSFNTSTESSGGLKDLLSGKCDVAGFAGALPESLKESEIAKEKIGRDAIGVIINEKNPVSQLSSKQLKSVFTGEITNWKGLGGPDKPIEVFIMDESSATHFVFRRQILNNQAYGNYELLSPDSIMIQKVSANPFSIGHVSLSFLKPFDGVKSINIDDQVPSVFNENYPIGRDLYLLHWKKNLGAYKYVKWVNEEQSQNLQQCGFQVHSKNDFGLLSYVGSSTVGELLQESKIVYPLFEYQINTKSESAGGEKAILNGTCDIAGVANSPSKEILEKGIRSTFIGSDAIAVIVNKPGVTNLTSDELKRIYTGEVNNWNQIGKEDGEIKAFRVSPNSATYHLFKNEILKGSEYGTSINEIGDNEILDKISVEEGAIGFITRSFIKKNSELVVDVNGSNPWNHELSYPLKRPLFLLWDENNKNALQFITWVISEEGQEVTTDLYTGSVAQYEISKEGKTGMLKVYTDVNPTTDAQVTYYPHTGFTVKTQEGNVIRYFPNNRGINDELPETVYLPEGKYIIVPETQKNEEFLIEILSGKTTVLHTRGKPKDKTENAVGKLREKTRSTYFQLYGDFRLRANYDNTNGNERFRGRYRFRIGTNIRLTDDFRLGARLVTSPDLNNYKSTHVNFDGFGQLRVGLDRLFIYYHPQKYNWFHLWVGKYALPYHSNQIYPENVWDEDIQPEGVTAAFKKNFKNSSEISISGGYYLFNAFSSTDAPTSMHSNEIFYKTKIGKRQSISLGNKFYSYIDVKGLKTDNNYFLPNGGNSTLSDSSGSYYKNGFNLNSTCLQVKLLEGKWPLLLKGEYVHNFSATSGNSGFIAGVSYGQLGRKNGWQFYFQYQKMQQDAVFTPFTQDDFLEQTQFSGTVSGVSWSLNKKMRLHAWLLTSVQDVSKISRNRIRLDLDIKF